MVDVPEYHTTIWVAMVDIMKNFISYGAVMENLDVDGIMKEAIEAHLLTTIIKTYVYNDMAQATSEATKFGYFSESMTQLVTLGAGGSLYAMHEALNMGDQNIGVLQQTLNGICNVVGTLEQKMNNLSQNGTTQLIRGSSTDAPRDDF